MALPSRSSCFAVGCSRQSVEKMDGTCMGIPGDYHHRGGPPAYLESNSHFLGGCCGKPRIFGVEGACVPLSALSGTTFPNLSNGAMSNPCVTSFTRGHRRALLCQPDETFGKCCLHSCLCSLRWPS